LGDRRECCIAWEIDKNVALQNINNIKNIVTSKFKEKMWCEKDLGAKRKLRYYKEVINPTLEDEKYLSVLMNSHELHSETGGWTVSKTPWTERSAISMRIRTSRMKIISS